MECLKKLAALPPRYITCVVLIPFTDSASRLSPSERRETDRQLKNAMENASKGVGTVIKMGKNLMQEAGLDDITQRLGTYFPSTTLQQRLYMSYSWLLFATLKFLECIGWYDELKEDLGIFRGARSSGYLPLSSWCAQCSREQTKSVRTAPGTSYPRISTESHCNDILEN